MINIDHLPHLQIIWYSYMCSFSHFELIPHQWQMMAFGSIGMNTFQIKSTPLSSLSASVDGLAGI
jgi:hypothetical protein